MHALCANNTRYKQSVALISLARFSKHIVKQ